MRQASCTEIDVEGILSPDEQSMSYNMWGMCFGRPNSICLNAMVRAYGRVQQLKEARAFVDNFHTFQVVPDKFTFTALLWTCGYSGNWKEAEEVFGQMKRIGCCPDGVTYTTWINTLEKNGQWEKALLVFENMQP